MEKTLTVNLNGVVFNINESAYQRLKDYMAELESHFSSDEDKEVLKDIEGRMAELLSERLTKGRIIVESADVEYLISVLGHVNEFGDDEDAYGSKKKEGGKGKRKFRRFYRDADNQVLGGVASGVSAYLGWDVTLVRILFVVLLVLGFGYMIPIYLIVWLIAPEAVTPAQKLEMQGEDVTVENIKNSFDDAKTYVSSDRVKESANKMGSRFLDVFRFIVKLVFVIIGFSFVSVCAAVLFALCVAAMFFVANPMFFSEYPFLMTSSSFEVMALFVSLAFLMGLPIVGLFALGIRLLRNKPRNGRRPWIGWTMFAVWIVSLLLFFGLVFRMDVASDVMSSTFFGDNNGTVISEPRQVGTFDAVDVSSAMKVTLRQDTAVSVRVVADANNVSEIHTEVRDGVLCVYNDFSYRGRRGGTVEIAVPNLRAINLSGASLVVTEMPMELSSLQLSLEGASKAELELDVENMLEVKLSGASKADVKGESERLALRVSGASKADMDQMESRVAEIDLSGASKAGVWVSDSLDMDLSGASKMEYKGTPYLHGSNDVSSVKRMKD